MYLRPPENRLYVDAILLNSYNRLHLIPNRSSQETVSQVFLLL